MEMIVKVSSNEINKHLPAVDAFICFSSFENRCYKLAKTIDPSPIKAAYVIRNIERDIVSQNEKNHLVIKKHLENAKDINVQLSNPSSIADVIYTLIGEIIENQCKNLVVDISSFTHETLLLLIKTLSIYVSSFDSIKLVYNGANEYASWLSKGCKEVRNIIGYPGLFKPSQKFHLIILTGFEKERATKLVELLEPDFLSIGNGIEPTDKNHQDCMCNMKTEFETWCGSLQGIYNTSFDFSCSDIVNTMDTMQKLISENNNHNIIIVPLNTKLSTIAVGLVALRNPKVQLCYPIPELYNMEYCIPSDNFTIVDLKEVLYCLEESK